VDDSGDNGCSASFGSSASATGTRSEGTSASVETFLCHLGRLRRTEEGLGGRQWRMRLRRDLRGS